MSFLLCKYIKLNINPFFEKNIKLCLPNVIWDVFDEFEGAIIKIYLTEMMFYAVTYQEVRYTMFGVVGAYLLKSFGCDLNMWSFKFC